MGTRNKMRLRRNSHDSLFREEMKMFNTESGMTSVQSGSFFDGISSLPANAAVTMAYVPFQLDTTRYDDEEALCRGTLFADLHKPFLRGALK